MNKETMKVKDMPKNLGQKEDFSDTLRQSGSSSYFRYRALHKECLFMKQKEMAKY